MSGCGESGVAVSTGGQFTGPVGGGDIRKVEEEETVQTEPRL